ncbi:MmcQ/YjbR family DNA-binding protein [Nocardioides sp. SYSU D00038]|uniref:MmcQ/YjbR family DNA-binding protein n=1 Tax=Nocardioides sp. SYSU D00038 TaxID=2812554 RepID=UPI0019680858|nr:MmcQ/YjbR family DNA-binding protein [Nocardioides sp. SYSU D00038]
MVTSDDVRAVALALPRAYERLVGGRWKLRVGQIVFCAFSRDETAMGFGYPRDARDGLVDGDPDTFFLPPARDLRYQWVCARLDRLDPDEMRELVTDAWRMCTPRMLHDLPEQPPPTAAAWAAMDAGDLATLADLLDPEVRFRDRRLEVLGRTALLEHLRHHPAPRPPDEVEVRDGRVRRWERG